MSSGQTKEVLLIALKPPCVEEGQADIYDVMAANIPLLFVSAKIRSCLCQPMFLSCLCQPMFRSVWVLVWINSVPKPDHLKRKQLPLKKKIIHP